MGREVVPILGEQNGGGGVGLEGRVSSLENRMTTVEVAAKVAADNSALAVKNTAELLAIATATKTVAGFVVKHGPKVLSYGAGIMTVLGIGNPELWHTIGTFFGR